MRLLALFLAITISVNIGCNKSTEPTTPEKSSNETTSENQGSQEKEETSAAEAKTNKSDATADQENIPSAAQIAALLQTIIHLGHIGQPQRNRGIHQRPVDLPQVVKLTLETHRKDLAAVVDRAEIGARPVGVLQRRAHI